MYAASSSTICSKYLWRTGASQQKQVENREIIADCLSFGWCVRTYSKERAKAIGSWPSSMRTSAAEPFPYNLALSEPINASIYLSTGEWVALIRISLCRPGLFTYCTGHTIDWPYAHLFSTVCKIATLESRPPTRIATSC